jgi:hypothetical protein
MKTGVEKLTDTTGAVRGLSEIRSFLRVARHKFSEVQMVEPECPVKDFLQYTLLTENRIRIYYKA